MPFSRDLSYFSVSRANQCTLNVSLCVLLLYSTAHTFVNNNSLIPSSKNNKLISEPRKLFFDIRTLFEHGGGILKMFVVDGTWKYNTHITKVVWTQLSQMIIIPLSLVIVKFSYWFDIEWQNISLLDQVFLDNVQ